MMKNIKSLWNRFGYYIALFAVVALIGTAAYTMRNGFAMKEPEMPQQPPKQVTKSFDATLEDKSSVNVLVWPVSSGEIMAAYSPVNPIWSEPLKMYHTHEGVDIGTVLGQAVSAAMDGDVVAMYYDEMLGNTIEIKHEGGIRTVYANLSTLNLVKIGQSVLQGDIIAAVGDSSRLETAMGPHLHFEAYKDNVWLDLPQS